jgi:hypothetical protein
MGYSDRHLWPMRPRLTGRFELALASVLTFIWVGFLVVGASLAITTRRVSVAEEYEPAGTETQYGTLYLGSSNVGTDMLGDMVSATWYNTWFCGFAAGIAILIALPIAFIASNRNPVANSVGRLILRTSATIGVWPLFGLLVCTTYVYEILTTYSAVLFAAFVLPTAIHSLAIQIIDSPFVQRRVAANIAVWLRLWATIMMLLALLSFVFSIGNDGRTLASLARDNATLITFGVLTPLVPPFLMVLLAATLRLWATIIEDRCQLRLNPYADSWVFLPTILENELDERRVRKEYEGLY